MECREPVPRKTTEEDILALIRVARDEKTLKRNLGFFLPPGCRNKVGFLRNGLREAPFSYTYLRDRLRFVQYRLWSTDNIRCAGACLLERASCNLSNLVLYASLQHWICPVWNRVLAKEALGMDGGLSVVWTRLRSEYCSGIFQSVCLGNIP
jgi:hypothetical protein